MAQVFTLDFHFQHRSHSAVVSVRNVGTDKSVSIQILGNDLRHVVPNGELSFRLSNAIRQPAQAPRPGFNELERQLRVAVVQHLRQPSAQA